MMVLRIVTGLILLAHGIPKILNIEGFVSFVGSFVPSPLNWVAGILTLIIEVIGGIFLLIGFKTRLTGLAVSILFALVALVVHSAQFFQVFNRNPGDGQSLFEFPLLIAVIGFTLFTASGGGRGGLRD